MDKTNRDLEKLKILLHAVESLKDEEPNYMEDLLMAGQEVMDRNPGIGFDKWVDILMRQYPTEVVDAVGSHPAEAYASLEEIWESHFKGSYNDENTPDDKSIAGMF